MDKLINDLTQKEENKALKAAQAIVNEKNVNAFKKLCEKSDFLFDFVKNNVRNRLKKAINQNNYQNIKAFFEIYDENYADTLIESLSKYASEELSDELLELLQNGTTSQKKYAAKYFSIIPDTIAQDTLEEYAFGSDMELSINSAQALGAMGAKNIYNKAIEMLATNDEFELIKAVRFLSAYADKAAVKELLKTLETTSAGENIAAEIPYLMSIPEMLEVHDKDSVLTCIDFILLGLGEIIPLSEVFSYEIYNVIETLINAPTNSHIAQVLLRAYERFSTLNENDEYSFDESKDVKKELKEIFRLLDSQPKEFWDAQKSIITEELKTSKQRKIAALEVIRALNIKSTEKDLINFIEETTDEQLIILAVGVARSLDIINKLNKEKIEAKISNETSIAILKSYFI